MLTQMIFAQIKLDAGTQDDLYVVPAGCTAYGTLFVAAHAGYDIVSAQMIPAAETPAPQHYIMCDTPLVGNVPIYLQQIYLGGGDRLRVGSQLGDSSFTFTGELYSS